MQGSKIVLSVTIITCILIAPLGGWGATPLWAAESLDEFNLELDIENDGSITIRELTLDEVDISIPVDGEEIEIHLDGVQLRNVSANNLEKLFASYGYPTKIPDLALDPLQVGLLVGHGVEHIGLRKESHGSWQELSLYINNTKTLEAEFADKTLDLLLAEMQLGEREAELVQSFLLKGESQVLVNLPKAESQATFADQIETRNTPPLNLVKAGATISGTASAGEILSVGGITFEEANKLLEGLGIPTRWPYLIANPLAVLETETVTAIAGRNGLRLDSKNGHWAQLAWDKEGREILYQMVPAVLDLADMYGYPLQVPEGAIANTLALVETTLPSTEIQLTIHNSEEQVDSSPQIQIGQVLTLEVDKAGTVLLEGVPAGTTFVDYSWIDYLGPVALSWDGEAKEIRYTSDGLALPPLFVAEDAAAQAGNIVTGGFPDTVLEEAPWSKIDDLLGNTEVSGIVIATAGSAPEELNLAYSTERGIRPQARALPSLVLDREGNIALGNQQAAFNLTPYLEERGISLTEIARSVPLGVEAATLSVDSNQVGISLNGANDPIAGLRWDYDLRQNAFDTADKAFGVRNYVNLATYGIADVVFPNWEETATEMVAGGRGFQWGVQLTLVDDVEELPPSPAEKLLQRLGVTP